jgi:hypothetical protein
VTVRVGLLGVGKGGWARVSGRTVSCKQNHEIQGTGSLEVYSTLKSFERLWVMLLGCKGHTHALRKSGTPHIRSDARDTYT